MENLELVKTLIRLAQIAELIEEKNPEAAALIDSFSRDVVKEFE
jgi:hypothetical protein